MQESGEAGAMPPESSQSLEGPFWETPERYGSAEALSSMGTIAAPLLGGFSLAAMVQTLTLTTAVTRWPDAALLLFLLAATLFIATVQAMFWARQFQASPAEIKGWWPDSENQVRLGLLQAEQARHARGFRMWSKRARLAYGAALLCLLAGLTVLAVPADSRGHVPVLRWAAAGIGALAFLAEALWIMGSLRTTRWKWAARLLTPDDIRYNGEVSPGGNEPPSRA